MKIRVAMIQPVIPTYRVPLFNALAAAPELELSVQASPAVPGLPDSVAGLPEWGDVDHRCRVLAGGRLFWQCGLRLPKIFGPGDVLVFNGNPRFLSTAPLWLEANRRGAASLWWGHGWSPTSVAWRARLRYRLMRCATATLLYTDAEVDEVRATKRAPEHVLGLNNTIDISRSRQASLLWNKDRLDAFRRQSGLQDCKLALFCGRLRSQPSTEIDVAFRAVAQLRRSDPTWRLAVIGTGEDEPRLRRLEAELGLQGAILWLGPIYDEERLAPWFLSAEFLVYPGAIGLTLLHAFSYGLPVITHSSSRLHNPEIAALRDDQNGLLFERGNVTDLAAQMHAMCVDPARRERMSAEALHTVSTAFSFDGMVNRFASAIRLASRVSLEGGR